MEEVIVVLLAVFAMAAKIASTARKGLGRTGLTPLNKVGRPEPQSMTALFEEMRSQLDRARQKQLIAARATPPSPVVKSSRTRAAMVTRTQRIDPVEVVSVRPPPAVVDYDAEAERLLAGRFAAAEETAKGRRPGDHDAFDKRTLVVAPAATAAHPNRLARLRTAVIWQEILGPPVSLR